jgi:hypothetical protein
MDPRDEKEDKIQRAVTAIAFVPADEENPSGCAHSHSAMLSSSSAVMVAARLFKLPETAGNY